MSPRDDIIRNVMEGGRPPFLYRWYCRIGRLVRAPWHRMRFRSFGGGARLDFPAFVIGAGAIEIGERALIGRGARFEAHFVREGETRIRIGPRTRFAPHVHIGAAGLVEIGAECGIGSYTWITDHDHDTSDPRNSVVAHKRIRISPTVIEDGVYIGERVAILRGVRIGRGSVIGTNSVVLHDVPPYSIAAGVPARVIKRFDPELGAWIRVADAGRAG